MKKINLTAATISELIEEFLRLAIAKGDAVMEFETKKVTRIYWQMEAVELELKNRPGDQRRTLNQLYQHIKPSVRLEAANATLAVLPTESRQVLQMIIDRDEFPFAGDAGMTLRSLETGFYKPT